MTTIPADLAHAEQVCASYSGGAAIDTTGKFHGWGGLTADFKKARFSSISCGSYHVLGITNQGQVVAWGNAKASKEILLPAELGVCTSVSAGDGASMALQSDGSVWVWGRADSPVKVQVTNVRHAQWFYRNGIVVQKDGTVLYVDANGIASPLREVKEPVPEGGGIIGDGIGHYAIWTKERDWKFFGATVNAAHCSTEAKGCSQIAFIGNYVFGIKPKN